jgi:1-deoxy-D-xylulose-5-phosphate reductoisomerase
VQASATRRKRVAILGSTGSVGVQALDVVARFPDELELVGVAAMRQVGLLRRQVEQFRPPFVAVECAEALDGSDLPAVAAEFGGELLVGPGACAELAKRCGADLVLVATVGVAGLLPTIAALEAGADIALANKEVLVMAGGISSPRRPTRRACAILPVDSEHNAIHQCLHGNRPLQT